MPIDRGLIRDALREPIAAIEYALSERLAAAHPALALLESAESVESACDVSAYADAGHCEILVRDEVHAEHEHRWRGPGLPIESRYRAACLEVRWEGHTLSVVTVGYPGPIRDRMRHYVLGETDAVARAFFAAVCEWCNDVHGEVLVFANGCWNKSMALRDAIRATTFDDLVLPEELKHTIRDDFRRFVAAEETYARHAIPWKRGVLLLGPPGNGKTHCIKAIVNDLSLACLYVQSFVAPHSPPQVQIAEVFRRARRTAPCLLVLEDLDSLIDDSSRAFFLNELDGFASNRGIVTIASTNHPERLDPAIVDRPSRFDRKYHFELPTPALRATYVRRWNERLDAELRVSDEVVERLTVATDGFSYAYLKELFVSSMMAWAGERERSMETLLESTVQLLAAQMASTQLGELREQHVVEDPHAWRRR